ncbi:polysaccharide export outer membrane protein [Roseivivax lentus]|uniref:Polysaccharide export outer membrane protein n=1 Tax=Roseivivax lentus TaxID=633194 RepID=A0A1N7Q2K6_9RHOB|nr:polysaccharide biosynthesis/export family protein [Roseivivax lentus]SIT16909.1 polysaccharide export outer membrane protein [Roseivivax lentus]
MQALYKATLVFVILTFAGLASAQSAYRISPGDTLQVEVIEDPSLNRNVVVLPDGRFSFPTAGSIMAAGRTVEQVTAAIAVAIEDNFASPPNVYVGVQPAPPRPLPPVTVEPREEPVIAVFLLGEVKTGGRIEMVPGTTFLQALAQAGGLTPFAATKRVQLRRTDASTGQQKVYTVNFHALSRGAALSRDIRLLDGDVILVPERRLFE